MFKKVRLNTYFLIVISCLVVIKVLAAGHDDFMAGMEAYKSGKPNEALKLINKAAESNDSDAQYFLGLMYRDGKTLTKDNNKAISWFRKSAEQGNSSGQFELGNSYMDGLGVTQDYKQAVAWYVKAAERNNLDAQLTLGHLYLQGKYVLQDYQKAIAWYHEAAEQGNPGAQWTLGSMRLIGVYDDTIEAYKWLVIAANSSDPKYSRLALENRNTLASRITKGQIFEAQKRAQEWQSKFEKNCENLILIEDYKLMPNTCLLHLESKYSEKK